MTKLGEGHGLSALRIGVVVGGAAGAALSLMALLPGIGPSVVAWLVLAVATGASVCVGAGVGGGTVLAYGNVRSSPLAVTRALVILIAMSLFVVAPYGVDALRAQVFLAHADSTQGVVTGTYYRGGKRLTVHYAAGDSSRVVSDIARRATLELAEGDPAWVFWDGTDPTRATVGRPGPDWRTAYGLLAPLWVIGSIVVLAYGVRATPIGLPMAWQAPVRLLRAYCGAAIVADIGFSLVVLLQSGFADPRIGVADSLRNLLSSGALLSLILTVVLGSLALPVLLERRWRSNLAFAVCGMVFGVVGGLMFGPIGLLWFGIPGVLGGFAFRNLYFWGGDPLATEGAAA